VFNAEAGHALGAGWRLLVRIENLFNRQYESFGLLGRNFFRGPGGSFDAAAAAPEQFRAPGSPRSAWLVLSFDYR
jgi:hypothetical protein